jgi:excisionase family DNA binding protein
MTLREASKYLNIPERTFRHYRNLDRGPRSYRLGGKLFFDRTDLDA